MTTRPASSLVLAADSVAPARGPNRAAASAAGHLSSLGISMRGIAKAYKATTVLRDVSLDVAAGEFLTLLGPSGSGKTTLLNIIAGFTEPDAGNLHFGDQDVTALPVNRRGLGVVFQNYALFPHMTVAENVGFPLTVRRLGRADIAARVKAVLDLVKLGGLADRNVAALSGGQRQRVALARAVVFSPRIVLMDEPLSALDKSLREEMQVEIRRLHERFGATTIYVTHDQREALTISDRIAVMNGGRIVQCGTPQFVYERPSSLFVARFIGETTLLPVTRTDAGIRLPDGTGWSLVQPLPEGRELMLLLRAEKLRLAAAGETSATGFAALVRDVIYQGDSLLVLAALDGAPDLQIALRQPVPAQARPAVGDRVRVCVDPNCIVVLANEGEQT